MRHASRSHSLSAAARLAVAATGLAALLRLPALETLAPAAWFDEVWFALRARELLQTGQVQVFYPTAFGGANAGLAMLTALAQALGLDGITAARWVLAVGGVLSVPLAYACLRELLARPAGDSAPAFSAMSAALAALVLAYTLFFAILTRVGMESGLAPAAALLAVWQIRRGARGRWAGWLLAGLAAGLAQYNGLHARLVLPVAGWAALEAILTARGPDRQRALAGAALMIGAAALAALPLIAFFIRQPEWLTARAALVARDPGQTLIGQLAGNLRLIVRAVSLEGSYDPKTTVPGIPLLDAVQSAGFWVGLGWAALRAPRRAEARLLLVWLLAAALPGLLTEGAPNLQRMAGVAAPLAALTALGWEQIYRRLAAAPVPAWRRLLPAGAAALIAVSAGWHAYLLYVRWPQTPILRQQFTAAPVEIARDLIARSAAGETAFAERAPEAEDIAAFEYLLPGTPVQRLDFRQCLPLPDRRAAPTAYLVLTDRDPATVNRLREAYPSAWMPYRERDLFGGTGTLVEIPAGASAPPPPRPASARFAAGIALAGWDASTDALRPGETLFVTLYWRAGEPVAQDLTAFAHLGSGLPGEPPILAQRDGQPCVGLYPTSRWQPGEIVPDSFAITLPADAPPGEYPLAVGWYAYPSLERLPLLAADPATPDGRAVPGTIRVLPP